MAAAYAATCRRILLMGNRSQAVKRAGFGFRPELASVSRPRRFSDAVNPNHKRWILVDTLALVRKFEAEGFPTKHAEAITQALKEVQNDNVDTFVSKEDMDKNVMKLETEVHNTVTRLEQENEKLKADIEKIRSEMKYENDKVQAGLRLDLNLEKGRMRDELNNQHQETANINSKFDREVHGLRASIEALKYCLGIFVSLSAVVLALLRMFL